MSIRYGLITLHLLCTLTLIATRVNAQALPEREQLPQFSGTVFRVNDDAITSTQIIDALQDSLCKLAHDLQFAPFVAQAQSLVSREAYNQLYNLVVYQRAQSELDRMDQAEEILENALAAERKQILRDYGGSEARARTELARQGTSIEKMLDERKRALVISAYRDAHFNVTLEITRSQLLQYYRAHIGDYTTDASIRFRLIDIQVEQFLPEGTDESTAEQVSKAREKALQQTLEALQRIRTGEDFGLVAQELSHGIYRKLGGLWRPRRPDSFPPVYQPVIKALASVSVGQCTPVVESEDRFFIAMLVERQGGHVTPFAEAQFDIEDNIRQQRWRDFTEEMAQDLLGKATTGDLEGFIKATITLAYQQCQSSAQP